MAKIRVSNELLLEKMRLMRGWLMLFVPSFWVGGVEIEYWWDDF